MDAINLKNNDDYKDVNLQFDKKSQKGCQVMQFMVIYGHHQNEFNDDRSIFDRIR